LLVFENLQHGETAFVRLGYHSRFHGHDGWADEKNAGGL